VHAVVELIEEVFVLFLPLFRSKTQWVNPFNTNFLPIRLAFQDRHGSSMNLPTAWPLRSFARPLFRLAYGMQSALLNSMVAVIPKRTARQVQREVRAMNTAAKQINKSATSARKFLQKNGFITKQNKVSAHYR
jgi:hypothetical protein